MLESNGESNLRAPVQRTVDRGGGGGEAGGVVGCVQRDNSGKLVPRSENSDTANAVKVKL